MNPTPIFRIPFKDPEVKKLWDYFYLGFQTYETTRKQIHKLMQKRVKILMANGMPEGEAFDTVIDDVYQIDHAELKKRKKRIMDSVQMPF